MDPHDTPDILDIEASGFGTGSYPIEVGYVLGDGRSHCCLIRPAEHWTHWDDNAQLVHRIERPTLIQHGMPITEVARLLNDNLAGRTLYTDGWAHDYPWLNTLFEVADLTPQFRLESLRTLLTEDDASRWQHAKQRARADAPSVRHRASADARWLQSAWKLLRAPAN